MCCQATKFLKCNSSPIYKLVNIDFKRVHSNGAVTADIPDGLASIRMALAVQLLLLMFVELHFNILYNFSAIFVKAIIASCIVYVVVVGSHSGTDNHYNSTNLAYFTSRMRLFRKW